MVAYSEPEDINYRPALYDTKKWAPDVGQNTIADIGMKLAPKQGQPMTWIPVIVGIVVVIAIVLYIKNKKHKK